MIKLIHEDANWATFEYSHKGWNAILVISKELYSKPPQYNSVVGRFFPENDGTLFWEIENGSFLKQEIDSWFETLDK